MDYEVGDKVWWGAFDHFFIIYDIPYLADEYSAKITIGNPWNGWHQVNINDVRPY